jgi:long-chain acyl-CoA synthetase
LSYAELKEVAERLAASLHRHDVKKGDKVVLYLYNIPQFIIAWLALQRLGCVPVPISPVYTSSDIRYVINDSGAETIFCMDTNFGYVDEVRLETCLKRIVVTTFIEMLPWWKKALGRGFDRVPMGRYSRGEQNIFSFGDLIRKASSSSSGPPYDVQSEDVALMLYTGGTLGSPKGVPYTNGFFLENQVFREPSTAIYS